MAGSFASAATHRLPNPALSLTRPLRSFCPACKRTLPWYENLPILGWLWLRGRCRGCGVSIGAGYLVHEVGLALVFLWVSQMEGILAHGPVFLVFLWLALTALWIAAAVDFRHFILPDEITLGGIPAGILASALVPQFPFWASDGLLPASGPASLLASLPLWASAGTVSLLSALAAGLLLFGIRALFSYLLRQEALGLGDVKFLAAVGAWTGFEGSLWTFLVGVGLGALMGVANVLRMIFVVRHRRRSRGRPQPFRLDCKLGWLVGRRIPFGPPLVLGAVWMLLAPDGVRTFFLETWPTLLRDWAG